MKRKVLLITLCVVIGFAISGAAYGLLKYYNMKKIVNTEKIYNGIYIDDIHIGGLTTEEVLNIFEDKMESFNSKEINVIFEDEIKYTLTYSDFDFTSNYKELVESAYNVAREGKLRERYKKIKEIEENNIVYNLEKKCNIKKVEEFVHSIKNDFSVEPKNAIIQRINGQFIIEEEVNGYELKVEESTKLINEALNEGQTEVKLEVNIKKPEYTKEYFENINSLLGGFYTQFSSSQPERNENLKIASSRINGTLLMPGDVFSTNKTIDVSVENGYKSAPVIVNGKLQPGIGGGVCQIASTLYNAVLFSELEIVERKNHSMPVGYIDKGRDATLAGDYIDFKFKNNMEYPIYIESYIDNNKLYMNIYGKELRQSNRKIEFKPSLIKVINPPAEKIIIDNTLKPGERIVQKKGRTGYVVELYKLIYIDDKFIESQLIDTSYYQAVGSEVRVGKIETNEEQQENNMEEQTKEQENNIEEDQIDETMSEQSNSNEEDQLVETMSEQSNSNEENQLDETMSEQSNSNEENQLGEKLEQNSNDSEKQSDEIILEQDDNNSGNESLENMPEQENNNEENSMLINDN